MIFKDTKKANTILLLESLKKEKDNLTTDIAYGFAAKTLELIKKAVGEESEQYKLMQNLFYDQTAMNLQRRIVSADLLIVIRVKEDGLFDSIIDTCIESVKMFGLYKPPSEKKNVLGDLDNSMLWTIIGAIVLGSFSVGIIYSKYGVDKLLQPTDRPTTQQEHKPTKQTDHSRSEDIINIAPPKKSHPTQDSTLKKGG